MREHPRVGVGMRMEAHDLDLRQNWYRRHTAVVGVLAASTSLFVGIAAAGGLAILSDGDELPSAALSPTWINQPPVVIEADSVEVPAMNPAAPAAAGRPVPEYDDNRQWRMDDVDHSSDVSVNPVTPSRPEPEPESGRQPQPQPPSSPDQDCRGDDDGWRDVIGRVVEGLLGGPGQWASDDADDDADATDGSGADADGSGAESSDDDTQSGSMPPGWWSIES